MEVRPVLAEPTEGSGTSVPGGPDVHIVNVSMNVGAVLQRLVQQIEHHGIVADEVLEERHRGPEPFERRQW